MASGSDRSRLTAQLLTTLVFGLTMTKKLTSSARPRRWLARSRPAIGSRGPVSRRNLGLAHSPLSRSGLRLGLLLLAGLVILAAAPAAFAGAPKSTAAAAAAGPIPVNLYAGMRWRLIGPYRSGNVYAVTGVIGQPAVYYIGTPEGGVWKTTDAGTVWKPIFDAEHVPSIGAIAVAQSSPRTVYVGTGDPTEWSFTPGRGMYKSTDGGRTWRNIGLKQTRYITAVLVDPRNPNVVIVGALGSRDFGGPANTHRGVYRTTNGGRTWRHVLYKDAYTGVASLVYDFRDPKVIYAAFARSTFGLSKAQRKALPPLGAVIYKSTNEGKSWKPLSGKGLPVKARSFRLAVADGTHGQRVYAEAQGFGRDAQGLYRSDNGGRRWRLETHHILSAGGKIYVDPGNPDVVYLMGTAMYRSVDGGKTVAAFKGSPGGDDERDLWVDPANPRRMILGVDQGPAISMDGGKTWTPWFNLPNGQFYNVFTDNHFPFRVYGAQQDSGTACVLSRSDYGEIRDSDWYPVGGFENGYIAPDPLNPRWVFTQGWYHVLRRYDRKTGMVSVFYTPTPADRFTGAPPLMYSPVNPHVMYMAAQYVMESTDGARTWFHISPDLTIPPGKTKAPRRPYYGPAIQTLAPSPLSARVIWAGTNDGLIQLTRDKGATWKNVTPPGLPAHASINIIDASHANAGTAYAAVETFRHAQPYIYRTTDFGKTWQEIVRGLPKSVRVRVVREDPKDPDLLYAGTEMGAYVSFDRGDDWQSLQLNLPNTVVSGMTVHGNDLVISTYGRAFWILDDVTPLRQAAEAMAAGAQAPAYLYKPEPAWRVRWDNDQDTPLPPEVPAGQNPPQGAIVDYYLPHAVSGPVTLDFYDAAGDLVRQYSSTPPPPDTSAPDVPMHWFAKPVVLPASAGMHRIAWDLRYPPPLSLTYSYFGNLLDYTEYTLTWHAIEGHTPRIQPVGPTAIPGVYTVKLTVDGRTFTRRLTVKNDPRISILPWELGAELRFERQITTAMGASYHSFQQLSRLSQAARRALAAVKGQPQLAAGLRRLEHQAEKLANGKDGAGLANRGLGRHLEDMEFGDLLPTASDRAAVEGDCQRLDAALAGLRSIEGQSLPTLNQQLGQAGLAALPTATAPNDPACGERR
jgi:photosystem II stability/assembly factor-like uncharacterized protein